MGETTVVGPGLTPDWLDKRNGVIRAIDDQLVQELRRPGSGWSLDGLQKAIVEKGAVKSLRPRSIVTLRQIPVNYDRSWSGQIATSGPNTGADYDVRKIGDFYVAESKGIVPTDITLVNFGQDVRSDPVLQFATEWQLGRAMNPQECFAIGEHYPKLNTMPGFFDPMAIVSLKECSFRDERPVCFVWFGGDERRCNLHWFGLRWHGHCWFGFVRYFPQSYPALVAGFSLLVCLYQPPSILPISFNGSES